MTQLTILPIILPLITAVLSIIARENRFRDFISISGSIAYFILIISIASKVLAQGTVTYQAGGWPAPFGVTFIVDSLSLFMLLITATVSLAANLYSVSHIDSVGKASGFYAFFHFMVMGMSGAFITGDIFNLFVMLEITLMSSYAMVAYTGTKESLFTSLKYVVLNLLGSSIMLIAIGGLYSVTGTLNMADLALTLSKPQAATVPAIGLISLLFSVFALKSGLVPFHFWAPAVYSNSPPPAAAMMAGVSKKVGIYAVIRLYITVFSEASTPENALILPSEPVTLFIGFTALLLGAATVLLGGISAVNRNKLEEMLSYSSIGQVGFIFIPLAFALIYSSQAALVAALIYILSHSLAKPALFMISGTIEEVTGTTELEELGGLSERSFALAAAFFISAFSLVGIPPLLGFFGKMLVFQTAVAQQNFIILTVLLIGAISSLIYFGKAWLSVFFGEPVELVEEMPWLQVFAVTFLAALILTLGAGFEPVYDLALDAAEAAFDTEVYIDTVLGDTK